MGYFVIDTETTGLPARYLTATTKNVSNWDGCRLLSIAVVEYNDAHEEQDFYYKLVKDPNGVSVTGTEIHGITQEMVDSDGVPLEDVFNFLQACHYFQPHLVAHNAAFDMNVIKSELIRHGMDHTFMDEFNVTCSLKLARSIYKGSQCCKLGSLYKRLCNSELEGAHNALADCRGCSAVYTKLLEDPRRNDTIPVKIVVIGASKVAAAIGKNPYQRQSELLVDLHSKYHKATCAQKTELEVELEAISKSKEAQDLVETLKRERPASSEDVEQLCIRARAAVDCDVALTEREKGLVLRHVKHAVYTQRGTLYEDCSAEADSAQLYTDTTYYRKHICTIGDTRYIITGRIDRYEELPDGSRRIVEIKNRVRKLHTKPQMYEVIQVQTYMALTNLLEARLLQQLNQQQQSSILCWDADMWNNTVLPKLEDFCKTLHDCMVK